MLRSPVEITAKSGRPDSYSDAKFLEVGVFLAVMVGNWSDSVSSKTLEVVIDEISDVVLSEDDAGSVLG